MQPLSECHYQNSPDFCSLSFRSGVLNSDAHVQFMAGNSENDIMRHLRQVPSPGEHRRAWVLEVWGMTENIDR
jgi:hypothetical protein